VRLLKSPHNIVISYGYATLSMSATNCVAVASYIFLFSNDVYGGIYIFIILIRVLLGNNNLVSILYSLICDVSIYSGFRTYVARPPRVLPARRDSTNRKPSRVGGAAPSAIHVSYKHSTSISSCSSISSSFM
jgi:hypothetical protein